MCECAFHTNYSSVVKHIIKTPGEKNTADVFQVIHIRLDEFHILMNGFRDFGMGSGKQIIYDNNKIIRVAGQAFSEAASNKTGTTCNEYFSCHNRAVLVKQSLQAQRLKYNSDAI